MEQPFRILVVDDDKLVRALVCRVIKNQFSHVLLIEATTGEEALHSYARQGADLVITDYHMPRMNGLGLVSNLRAIDQEVPILFLSGDYMASQRAQAAGVNYVIEKPFPMSDLKAALAEFIPQK